VIQKLKGLGYEPVQCRNSTISRYRFVFASLDGDVLDFAVVDVMFDYCRQGLTLASGAAMVQGRGRRGSYWAADPAAEFTYLLSEAILDRNITETREQRLRIWRENWARPGWWAWRDDCAVRNGTHR